jgi:sigma-B regulation protein RsbU (phosphoserine phosphatase)
MPTYLVRPDGIEMFDSTGIPFGILTDFSYSEQEITVAPGEMLVLFTDGVSEAMREEEFFDEERFREVLLANAGAPLRKVRETVMAAIESFIAGAKRTDDITLLLMRRTA